MGRRVGSWRRRVVEREGRSMESSLGVCDD
jgi:hypothetical protein